MLVHDGGPRFTKLRPEMMWVHVTSQQGLAYVGTLLNAPQQLHSVRKGANILFIPPKAAKFPPIYTSAAYLAERDQWEIVQCDECGFDELFDAPSQLIKRIFPNAPQGAVMSMFTSFCPLCGGVQVIKEAGSEARQQKKQSEQNPIAKVEDSVPQSQQLKRPWWRFW